MTNTTITKPDAVVRRLYARGNWKLKSVAHFGGDETGIADMCLLQDADGKPFIPGASIAGAARSLLAQQCLTWEKYKDGITQETPGLKRLFGGAEKAKTVEDSDPMSALIVADAACVNGKIKTSIRDGVHIVAESGTAAEGAKFDVEVVERGTEFELELVCIIRDGDDQCEFKELFLAILHAFQQGDIRLGARTRRGYGRGKVESWKIRDLQMNNPEDVMAWLRNNPWSRSPNNLDRELDKKLKDYTPLSDHRRSFRIEANFELRTSLLIRSSSENPEDPDMVHLYSNEKPVIPGTSFAGTFRQRASLIAYALNWDNGCNDADPVCEMFGAVHEQDKKTEDTKQTELWASRVSIEERLVEKVKPLWQDRVAIDRFTGGSLQSALFNEKPVYPCPMKTETQTNVRLILTLEEPEKAEIGLLLLTLRDFWSGHAVLGGETSNGRGTLQGIKAKLIYKDTHITFDAKEWQLTQNDNGKRMTIEEDDEGFLQSCVDAAQNYKERPTASRRPESNNEENTDVE